MIEGIYTVSDVNRIIKQMIETRKEFFNIQIRGEVSNFRRYASGHCYFTLKDKNSIIKAVMFRSRAAELKSFPKDGDEVLAIGRIGVYEHDGVYQLYADILITSGAGDLMVAYEILKEKLGKEGLFDLDRKREIPTQPQTIGIITSESGAAVHDIITVARRRSPGIKLILYPVKVQGNEAGDEIVKAISYMNEHKLAEVLIVGRGGGSIEDLWAFNEEKVVRAIALSVIPIVTAIGHETDFTLADFAADRRAATPSQAAEIVVPNTNELAKHLSQLQSRNIRVMKAYIENNMNKIKLLANSLVLREPERWLADKKILVDDYTSRMISSIKNSQTLSNHKHELLLTRLNAASPLAIMSRGYSIARKADGKIIKTIEDVNIGEMIEIVLSDGLIISNVDDIKKAVNSHGSKEKG